MKLVLNKIFMLVMMVVISISMISCTYIDVGTNHNLEHDSIDSDSINEIEINEEGYFTSKEDVALYIYIFNKLPSNFITKDEAKEKGWESSKGNLWEVTDRLSIGGDKFGNREGSLEKKNGRQYFECDIDYNGGYRGAKRLVYSNDGLVYYTDNHYDSFTLLFGE